MTVPEHISVVYVEDDRLPQRYLEARASLADITDDLGELERLVDELLAAARLELGQSAPGAPTLRPTTVEDHGAGIAPEDLPHVFTPFFRADPSRSRRTGGFGLGLSLARRIAEAHGGRLGLASEPRRVTRAVLVLPRSGALNERASGSNDARAA